MTPIQIYLSELDPWELEMLDEYRKTHNLPLNIGMMIQFEIYLIKLNKYNEEENE